jgi:hypothetical protein
MHEHLPVLVHQLCDLGPHELRVSTQAHEETGGKDNASSGNASDWVPKIPAHPGWRYKYPKNYTI